MTPFSFLSLVVSLFAAEQTKATRLEMLTLLPSPTGLVAVLEADGPLEHRIVPDQNPSQRIILDVLGVSNPLRHYYPPETHPFLERILMYEYPEATNPNLTGPLARIVFELKRDVGYDVEAREHALHVTLTDLEALAESDSDVVIPSPDEDDVTSVDVDDDEYALDELSLEPAPDPEGTVMGPCAEGD